MWGLSFLLFGYGGGENLQKRRGRMEKDGFMRKYFFETVAIFGIL